MDRGQAYTLEGIIGAIVIASALVIGLQAVDPAPWTEPGPTNPEELRTQGEDLIDAASDRGALHTGLRCTRSGGSLDREGFVEGTAIGALIDNTLGTGNYRISIEYREQDGDREEVVVVPGRPGRTSATVTRQVALFDSDARLEYRNDECQKPVLDEDPLGDNGNFYINDEHPNEELYVVVTIRVIVW